jgi:preprotein translocase subunit SecE
LSDEITIQKPALVRLREYLSDVRNEMRRVTWPGKQEIYGTTAMVVLTTFLFGVYFWICDQTFQHAMASLLKFLLHRG